MKQDYLFISVCCLNFPSNEQVLAKAASDLWFVHGGVSLDARADLVPCCCCCSGCRVDVSLAEQSKTHVKSDLN